MMKSNHRTLTSKFLDASNLKKLKNKLKSSGIQNKRFNHYLQVTYRIINDLESAKAEHRWNSKFARPAHKEYVNTVEFVRFVAEIVSGHILNSICGGSEGSPKADDDDIAERLMKELLSLTGATDQGHTHGDHIRSGVVNAVAEMLTTAKSTGGLPGVVNVAKTTLSPKAEAERRRRGAAAAAFLASGKHNYDYCDPNKSNPRAKASQNKKYEVPKFVSRKSNHRCTDAAVVDEKRTSLDGVKSTVNPRSVIKAPVRPKPDKSGNGKGQRTSRTKNVVPKFRLEKTIGSRTDQTRQTNGLIDRTNYASKVNAQKTVGEGVKSRNSKFGYKALNNIGSQQQSDNRKTTLGEGVKSGNSRSNFTMKTRDRIPRRQTAAIGANAVNKTRSIRQSKVLSGANSQTQKKSSRLKPSAVDGPDKARKVRIEKTAGSLTDQKRPTNGIQTSYVSKMNARKTVREGVKSGNSKFGDNGVDNMRSQKQNDNRKTVREGVKSGEKKFGDNGVNNVRSQKRSDVVRRTATKDDRKKSDDPVPAIATDKNRKPRTTGAQLKEIGGTSGTRRKTGPLADVEGADDDKNRKLYNGSRNILGADGVAEKSKTTGTRNTADVGKNPKNHKNPKTKNGVGQEKRDETKISETLISPPIDYHDDALLTAARDGINEPIYSKGIFSVAEAIDVPRAPGYVQADHGGGGGGSGVGSGGKNAVPSEKLISPRAIDYHDDFTLKGALDGTNEQVDTKRTFSVGEVTDSPRAPADVPGDDGGGGGGGGVGSGGKNAIYRGHTGKNQMFNERDRTGPESSETGRNRIGERNQDETGHKTSTPTVPDVAGSGRRTDNSCTDDDIYKLRVACVLSQLDRCQNKETSLYQAKRKGSKFEVTGLTKEEYCKRHKYYKIKFIATIFRNYYFFLTSEFMALLEVAATILHKNLIELVSKSVCKNLVFHKLQVDASHLQYTNNQIIYLLI